MSENNQTEKKSGGIPNPITELVSSFRALKGANKGFWFTNIAYWLDGISYFGMLTLMTMFFHDTGGFTDNQGHLLVSIYTGLISGTMLVFGPISDKLGVRRSLIISIVLYLIGRSALPLLPDFIQPGTTTLWWACFVALFVAATGNGFMQPSCYAGVKKFADQKTAAMGYGLLYAGMNLGIVIIGLISPRIRTGLSIGGLQWDGWGIEGVFWFCIAVNALMLLGVIFFITPKLEREAELKTPDDEDGEDSAGAAGTAKESRGVFGSIWHWITHSPLANGRFMYFIFALLPVQTLFAYQWLVMPQYITRAYSEGVANNMESLVNVANPLIIVLGVPIITAMTRRVSVYTMMIAGSLVSAVPTFFFVFGPNLGSLMTYFILFSLGEAMWQPRFLQYAAELAPKGQTGAYVAFANIPWFMIKFLAGLYTGRMMERFCPDVGAMNTEMMWLIYGIIAISSPALLIMAKPWVQRGLKELPVED